MSVCFVSNDGTMQIQEENAETGSGEETNDTGDTQLALEHFWEWVMDGIRKVTHESFKNQVLPLARVKKIMKLDEEVKMISAEAPMLFAKASEIFIHELTLRAWSHTEDNKRRTLQRNDIAMAIIKSDQFDFLIDIVPRHDIKPTKSKEETKTTTSTSQDQVQYYFHLAQQHQSALQNTGSSSQIISPTSLVTQPTQVNSGSVSSQSQSQSQSQSTSSTSIQQQQQMQPLQIVQQVSSTGELQQVPIQLTPSQMHMIRMQMQNNSGQPIIIHANPGTQQQLIQVQPQQPQQLYLTIASSDNE